MAAAARRRADAEGVGVALDWEPKEAMCNQAFGVDSIEGRDSDCRCGEVGRGSWRDFGGLSRLFIVYWFNTTVTMACRGLLFLPARTNMGE